MNERLKQLYKSHILKKAKDDTHFGELPVYTHLIEAYNPMCGDKYTVYLQVSGGTVTAASFQGFGCAISKASTAVLTERLIGTDLAKVKALVDLFLELIDPESKIPIEQLTEDEELWAFTGTRDYPERIQCAGLAWKELAKSGTKLLPSPDKV
ncbi:MAG: SUF system NifU family Fe-S cluster assembly protein [Roseivirga sp.]